MLRSDYDRFKKIFVDPSGLFVLKCGEVDTSFPCAFTKIIDTRTILYEPDKEGVLMGVFVDVIPLDNIPSDSVKVRRIYRKRDILKFFSAIRANMVRPRTRCRIIVANCLRVVLSFFPENFFINCITNLRKKYSSIPSPYVGDYTCVDYIKADKKWFDSFIKMEFEGGMYSVPIGYASYLENIYGKDYLTPPPVCERKTAHSYEVYYK